MKHTLALTHTPAIGVNEFGDSGGIRYSAGNLIPGGDFATAAAAITGLPL